ncbi:hypothetical protein SBOR_10118 [Sclerotinia borealis F-4128]|uniref:Uncharacterized protein n=1 Tax=Sclerotinia borealis (strain F-4128) TaxID=1432307 RepID=W9BY22_SCLBF|nr:hypothetical protein SBOR_10118 [Sclerotinia borealis F-4128]
MVQKSELDIDIYGDLNPSKPKENIQISNSEKTALNAEAPSFNARMDNSRYPPPMGPRNPRQASYDRRMMPPPRPRSYAAPQPARPAPLPTPYTLWCARCSSDTHTFKDCVKCNKEGYMEGCPRCETLDHQYFECPIEIKRQEEYHYTRQCRRNRPPWRLRKDHRDIRKMLNGQDISEPDDIPWTAEFSRKNVGRDIPSHYLDPAWHDYDNVPIHRYQRLTVLMFQVLQPSGIGERSIFQNLRDLDWFHNQYRNSRWRESRRQWLDQKHQRQWVYQRYQRHKTPATFEFSFKVSKPQFLFRMKKSLI